MKKYIIIIILIFFNLPVHSYNLFETKFYEVEFISDNIDDEKIKYINIIKRKSILEILKNTITIEDNNSINNYLSEDLINTFIKNIIIEDEKIINDKYFSKIKINFNKNKIIEFLRKKKYLI